MFDIVQFNQPIFLQISVQYSNLSSVFPGKMAFVTSKVRLHLLCASVELLISLLLSSVTVATCLGDGKQQWDSKSVWDSTTPNSVAAEMNVTRQILVSPSKPQHLDEMSTVHWQIDGPNDGIATEKQPNLNFASSIFYCQQSTKLKLYKIRLFIFFSIRENDRLGEFDQ